MNSFFKFTLHNKPIKVSFYNNRVLVAPQHIKMTNGRQIKELTCVNNLLRSVAASSHINLKF